MFKALRMDSNTKARKADTWESEMTLPYNCVQITVGGEAVYLLARTKDEMKEWIRKLNKAAQADIF